MKDNVDSLAPRRRTIVRARDNPFAVHRLHALFFRLGAESWSDLEERLAALGNRGAIVGPEGSGKTTLLLELADRWQAAGRRVRHWQLRRDEHQRWQSLASEFSRPAEPHDWILLDGAEQLGFWNWRRVVRWSRAAAGLVITRHRPGQLPTWIRTQTSIELVDELVQELLGTIDDRVRRRNRRLFQQFDGNVRLILRQWYDDVSSGAFALPSATNGIMS